MAKHYLATRKPQRILRIREKFSDMLERGVPLARVDLDLKHRGHEFPVLSVMNWLEDLGYTKLTHLETLFDDIGNAYDRAKQEAISEIAHLAGTLGLRVDDVFMVANEIAPPPTAKPGEHRGIDPDIINQTRAESPFEFLRFPRRTSGIFYRWRNLEELTLDQLELVATKLKDRVPAPSDPPTPIRIATEVIQ